MAGLSRPDLPDGQARRTGALRSNFVGGFAESAAVAPARHGPALARYNLGGSPQSRRMRLCFGHLPEDAIAEGDAALAGLVHARLG